MIYLYLCSSPRHIYLALGLALSEPEVTHHLRIINQKSKANLFVDGAIRSSHPFASVEAMPLLKKRGKYAAKKQALRLIGAWLESNYADKIFCGNDRSIEFQYAMHLSLKMGRSTQGAYLDDGTGSYINGCYLKWSRAFTDLTVDRCLKWLFYGSWYHKVRYLGGTRWVKECYLNFPELAPEFIKKNKSIIQLDSAMFRSEAFLKALRTIASDDLIGSGGDFQLFLVLPLSKSIERFHTGIEEYLRLVNRFTGDHERIAVKYHPRETHYYFTSDRSVTVFPPSLPAEAIFSLVNVDCVIGDTSSALLSAQWLNPGARVICLCPQELLDNPVVGLMEATDIRVHKC